MNVNQEGFKFFGIALPVSMYNELQKTKKETGLPVTQIVRQGIVDVLKKYCVESQTE